MSLAPPTLRSRDAPGAGHAAAAAQGEDVPQTAEDGEELYENVNY